MSLVRDTLCQLPSPRLWLPLSAALCALSGSLFVGCSEQDTAKVQPAAVAPVQSAGVAGGAAGETGAAERSTPPNTEGVTGVGAAPGPAAAEPSAKGSTQAGGGASAAGGARGAKTSTPPPPVTAGAGGAVTAGGGGAATAGGGGAVTAGGGGAAAGVPPAMVIGSAGGASVVPPPMNAGAAGGSFMPPAAAADSVVVLLIIDGLQKDTAATAAANGAENLKMVIEQGVTVDEAYSVTPAPRLQLPDGSKPWGNTTAPNVAIHTGCHIYESREMDDIFLAAREQGIKSVYVGGDKNYSAFNTSDFHYASSGFSDAETIDRAVQHFEEDGVRLIRVHLQRIRDAWKGPAGKTDKDSGYIAAVVNADQQTGVLIDALKAAGVWDKTTLIISSDHGMGEGSGSNHPANVRSSWEIFMGFYGPGIKQGQTIAYAESPDMAILTAYVLGLRPLKGHTDPAVTTSPRGVTGTLLTNIFAGAPAVLEHPQPILKYLESENFEPPSAFVEYRAGLLELLQ